jgi:hypothetical protein
MFCQKCGQSLKTDMKFCEKCGEPAFKPSAELSESEFSSDIVTGEGNKIWNPNAACNWSIIFTPAFGSYLQALNWQALGEGKRARSAMGWFYSSLIMLLLYVLMGVLAQDNKIGEAAARGLGLLYLIVWYFSAGRAQAKYVKNRFGVNYPRRSWTKPLLIGVAAFAGYIITAIIIGFAVGLIAIIMARI